MIDYCAPENDRRSCPRLEHAEAKIIMQEAYIKTHGETLASIDGKLSQLMEKSGNVNGRVATLESKPFMPSNTFVGGIAATGAMMGAFAAKIGVPLVKPVLGLIGITIKG